MTLMQNNKEYIQKKNHSLIINHRSLMPRSNPVIISSLICCTFPGVDDCREPNNVGYGSVKRDKYVNGPPQVSAGVNVECSLLSQIKYVQADEQARCVCVAAHVVCEECKSCGVNALWTPKIMSTS